MLTCTMPGCYGALWRDGAGRTCLRCRTWFAVSENLHALPPAQSNRNANDHTPHDVATARAVRHSRSEYEGIRRLATYREERETAARKEERAKLVRHLLDESSATGNPVLDLSRVRGLLKAWEIT